MSRIGRMPIKVPEGVNVEIGKDTVKVSGPKGTLAQDYRDEVEIKLEDGFCLVTRRVETKQARALHGLYRKLVSNMVEGVSKGFTRVLLINGVGYRAEVSENTLTLNLGYSNPIEYPLKDGITISVEGNNKIVVSSHDRQLLGQTCAEIRSFRPPEPYKGKGIRYENEVVRRKIGKTGVK
jgi:large subunit ribosomal protein L6